MSSVTKIMQNRKQYKISLLIFNTEVKPGLLKSRNNFGVF
ncbi:hypothetical protein M093_3380 [Bacteroides uniformis str. 3978 T3 i]|jgi:hypothetical protein|uniref:Uncharacterized protein n=1 Tax=Bacteroides uniformis (strain ATCC 8492 / DSM 6597 / CCUG 4942 / CIP 103695 / JCM 5828 / KCTC 5204 / NCTC 13054 / VPI 0061) TaxID=411479 RepID=A0ABC9N7F4_BACUC|nr:hypothetical protein BACUNI_03421 [Bacteroides uniformis ATCC 8492]KDS58621.1 hypothetical protein M093_3380 [Bacteroides uniformis str. 3978 T3 i]